MRDILLDAFKLGLGAADLTKEKAEQLVSKVEKKYPAEIKDGRKMVDDLMRHAEKNVKRMRQRVEKELDNALKKQTLVHKSDFKELHRHVKSAAKVTMRIAEKATKRPAKKKTAKRARKPVTKKR